MTSDALDLRTRKKLAAREALARAALRLAVERGLDRVKVPDIAAAAGVSPRTFNNYFASKDEAIVWLAVERARRTVARFRERPAEEPLQSALLEAFAAAYRRPDEADAGTRARLAGHADPAWAARLPLLFSSPMLRGAYLKGLLSVEQDLADAVAERLGLDAKEDLGPRVLAASVLGAERAAIVHWIRSRGSVPIGELVWRALAMVLAQSIPADDGDQAAGDA